MEVAVLNKDQTTLIIICTVPANSDAKIANFH